MAEHEQQTEKKKPNLFWRIVKWIGLGLLTILLIAAFIFRAPWKVITLLVIFLLACTALPKPTRKWFWLSVGVVIIALIIWVFLSDETENWRPYTFDEELAVLEAKRAIPDSENAAVIYNQLLENYDSNAFEPDFLDPNLEYLTRTEPWSGEDYPEFAQWVKQHESTIAKLIEASKMERCRFPISCDIFRMDESMDRLAPMRRWAFLLSRVANNDIGEGRIDAGLEKYICVLKMADHMCQQPTMIDMLVGIAIETLALGRFRAFAVTGDATEQYLSVIEEALTEIKHDWTSDLPRILEGEKLLAKNFWGVFYAINPEGKVRLSRDPTAAMRAEFPEELPPPTYWQRKLTTASALLGWFFLPASPQKTGKIIDDCYGGLYAMAKPNFDWQKKPEEPKGFSLVSAKFNFRFMIEILVSIMEPAFHRIHDTYLRLCADRRGNQIIIALRRFKNKHGRWPESLSDVKDLASAEIFVDPINDSSFVYKLTDDNFTLYSKGKNNIDENGQDSSTWDPNTLQTIVEQDDVLIWPHRKCGTGKENADTE
jgi:hypothetical protein